MVQKVNQVAAEFRRVSNKQMAETTKNTIRENVSITAQLQKMSDKTMELIAENDELKKKEKQQKQHIEMLEENETALAKKNHSAQRVKIQFRNIFLELFVPKEGKYRLQSVFKMFKIIENIQTIIDYAQNAFKSNIRIGMFKMFFF